MQGFSGNAATHCSRFLFAVRGGVESHARMRNGWVGAKLAGKFTAIHRGHQNIHDD
jgi:hypothetical protein